MCEVFKSKMIVDQDKISLEHLILQPISICRLCYYQLPKCVLTLSGCPQALENALVNMKILVFMGFDAKNLSGLG